MNIIQKERVKFDINQHQYTMSWIYETPLSWIYRVCFYILKWGSVPKHVAIVMDGNRRFAKKQQIEKCLGHQKGFNKLTETLSWCLDLNIYEVTVYAFSIENFKRNSDEVNALMDLAKEKFKTLIDEWQKLKEHGICIRVIGNLQLLPHDLIKLILISMLLTKDNKKAYLNIAFSYTGKDEMCASSREIAYGLRDDKIKSNEITDKLIDQCLYTYQSTNPELVIRTSGEMRISDFLSWQISNSYIHFVNVLWPEFSAWNFMSAVFCYQHFIGRVTPKNTSFKNNRYVTSLNENSRKFADILQKERQRILLEICCDKDYDIEKVNSLTAEQIYEYYKLKIRDHL